ncbi:MAG: FHA domain-containing protein [Chloroflexota bacterium]|nr:FHA domain-containing protein [Chloroflexota bacterium]
MFKKQEIEAMEDISPPSVPFSASSSDEDESIAAIYLVDTADIIYLKKEKNYTIGRTTKKQMVIPDIDLTPYEAYKAGVSRLHANINTKGTQVTFKDLGSSNGSRLNGMKITARAEHTIQHGDIITLGSLKAQIFLRE